MSTDPILAALGRIEAQLGQIHNALLVRQHQTVEGAVAPGTQSRLATVIAEENQRLSAGQRKLEQQLKLLMDAERVDARKREV